MGTDSPMSRDRTPTTKYCCDTTAASPQARYISNGYTESAIPRVTASNAPTAANARTPGVVE